MALDAGTVDLQAADLTAAAKFPPVGVFRDVATGKRVLANGFRCVAAHAHVGRATTPTVVRVGDSRAALLIAPTQDRCLARGSADKHKTVGLHLADEEWQNWSDVELGPRAGVDGTSVVKIPGGGVPPVPLTPVRPRRRDAYSLSPSAGVL